MGYLYLIIAIATEVIGTSALNASAGFSKGWPSAIAVVGYALSLYFLALALQYLTVGIAYALWAGLGIVLVTVVAAFLFAQIPDTAALIGMALILAGVVVINLYSDTASL